MKKYKWDEELRSNDPRELDYDLQSRQSHTPSLQFRKHTFFGLLSLQQSLSLLLLLLSQRTNRASRSPLRSFSTFMVSKPDTNKLWYLTKWHLLITPITDSMIQSFLKIRQLLSWSAHLLRRLVYDVVSSWTTQPRMVGRAESSRGLMKAPSLHLSRRNEGHHQTSVTTADIQNT